MLLRHINDGLNVHGCTLVEIVVKILKDMLSRSQMSLKIIEVRCVTVHDMGNVTCVRRLDGGVVQQHALLLQKH